MSLNALPTRLKHLQGLGTLPLPWSACSNNWLLSLWRNSSWYTIWTSHSRTWDCFLVTNYWAREKESNVLLSITPFQGFLESKEISPQPSHLQTKEAQFPQSLLIKLCFLVLSLALLLFSVPAWATQYPLCSEELLTDCTTQGSV